MNIGILQVDSVLPQFQAAHGDYPDMFRGLLEAAAHANGQSLDVHNIDVLAGPLPEVDAFDAYVITGSKQSVYEDLPWLPPLVTFVGDAMAQQRPVIGICFGHQLLAHFFGGEVGPAEVGWGVGVHTSAITARHAWMSPAHDNIALLCSHKDQVRKLPDGAEVIASSEFCPIAGFRIGNRALTFQGHPEFRKAYSSDLMDMRQELLGPDTYENGKASLALDTQERDVARWILNFIGEAHAAA